MRTSSLPHPALVAALAFVTGWLSASMLTPPAAISQTAPRRAAAVAAPDPVIPQLTLGAVTAPRTPPAGRRNPFAFGERVEAGRSTPGVPPERTGGGMGDPGAPPVGPDAAADVQGVPPVVWRVAGIASDPVTGFTAVLSGAGVVLARAGDRLPDGAEVVDVSATFVTLRLASGAAYELRLP